MRFPNRLLIPVAPRLLLPLMVLLGACGHIGVDLDGDNDPLKAREDASTVGESRGGQGNSKGNGGRGGKGPVKTGDAAAGKMADASTTPPGMKFDGGPPVEKDDAGLPDLKDGGPPQDDGGMVDGGMTDPPVVIDSGMTDPPIVVDSGHPPIEPPRCDGNVCTCATKDQCLLRCLQSPCKAVCESGATCGVNAGEAQEVVIYCAEGASCQARNPEGKQVKYTCEGGGDCTAACGNAESCSIDCRGAGTCTLHCQEAAKCEMLSCEKDAQCYLQQGRLNSDSSVVQVVKASCEPRVECDNGLVACNTSCPNESPLVLPLPPIALSL